MTVHVGLRECVCYFKSWHTFILFARGNEYTRRPLPWDVLLRNFVCCVIMMGYVTRACDLHRSINSTGTDGLSRQSDALAFVCCVAY